VTAARQAGALTGRASLTLKFIAIIAGGVIGAVLGGGKGGAVGVGSAALSGQRVRVPSESLLIFTLTQPVTLNGDNQ
jgi:hypothetical protein